MSSRELSEETLRRLLVERELLRQTADVLTSRLNMVNVLINDLNIFKSTVENLKELKEEREILVPVGASSYVRAKISSVDKVLYAVGSDIFMEQDVDKALEDVEKRLDELHAMRRELQGQLTTVLRKLEESEKAIRTLSQAISRKHAGKAERGS